MTMTCEQIFPEILIPTLALKLVPVMVSVTPPAVGSEVIVATASDCDDTTGGPGAHASFAQLTPVIVAPTGYAKLSVPVARSSSSPTASEKCRF